MLLCHTYEVSDILCFRYLMFRYLMFLCCSLLKIIIIIEKYNCPYLFCIMSVFVIMMICGIHVFISYTVLLCTYTTGTTFHTTNHPPHTRHTTHTHSLLNSLAPGKFEWNFRHVIFKQSNIGSGNGLVPSGNKPLPELMLTQNSVAIWRHLATMS